jgi:hypothetical protein
VPMTAIAPFFMKTRRVMAMGKAPVGLNAGGGGKLRGVQRLGIRKSGSRSSKRP